MLRGMENHLLWHEAVAVPKCVFCDFNEIIKGIADRAGIWFFNDTFKALLSWLLAPEKSQVPYIMKTIFRIDYSSSTTT